MIIMYLKLNNIYSFSEFEIDFSYPKKIVNSLMENEHICNFPNFRYKKVNIIMGANATGKTTLGMAMTNTFSYLHTRNTGFLESMIADGSRDSYICIDLVDDGQNLKRIAISIKGIDSEYSTISERTSISSGSETIRSRDSYQSCLKRLLSKGLVSGYSINIPSSEWAMVSTSYNSVMQDELDSKLLLKVLGVILPTLDPSITAIESISNAENSFIARKKGLNLIFQNGEIINPTLFSSGTKEGIDLSYFLAGLLSHKFHTCYCDEKFSFVHSYLEKRLFGIMMSHLNDNEQLFFTTHNVDMLELNLPKHSYTFLIRELEGDRIRTKAIYANDYVKKYSDNLKSAIENDIIKALPDDSLLDTLEEL